MLQNPVWSQEALSPSVCAKFAKNVVSVIFLNASEISVVFWSCVFFKGFVLNFLKYLAEKLLTKYVYCKRNLKYCHVFWNVFVPIIFVFVKTVSFGM